MHAQNAALVNDMSEEERQRERKELIQKYGAGLLDRVQKAKAARNGGKAEEIVTNGASISVISRSKFGFLLNLADTTSNSLSPTMTSSQAGTSSEWKFAFSNTSSHPLVMKGLLRQYRLAFSLNQGRLGRHHGNYDSPMGRTTSSFMNHNRLPRNVC